MSFKNFLNEMINPEAKAPAVVSTNPTYPGLRFDVSDRWSDGSTRSVEIPIPERGLFITGSAGSGKTKTLIQPMLAQFIEQGYTGIMYDFKNPILATHVFTCFRQHSNIDVKDYYVNFTDMERTHRVNPLEPKFLKRSAQADMFAETILSNLSEEFVRSPNFFTRSSKSLFAAVIWYLAAEQPMYCTLPHALRMILSTDTKKLLDIISINEESESRVASIVSGLKSDNQTAGVVSTLQGLLAPLSTPEITWILSGSDFTLDLNNPQEKKFLSIGNTPDLAPILSPVISLLFSAALSSMNNQGKAKSCVVIDELPTILVPNLDTIPATGRENGIATVLSVQDYAQLESKYTDKKAEVIASVLNNQLYGKTTNHKTAERISKLFGMEDKVFKSESFSRDNSSTTMKVLDVISTLASGGKGGSGSTNTKSTSYSVQQRARIKPEEVLNLNSGEFIGTLVGSWKNQFKKQLKLKEYDSVQIPAFKTNIDLKENTKRIREEVRSILSSN